MAGDSPTPSSLFVRLVAVLLVCACVRARKCLHTDAFPYNTSTYRPYNVTLYDVAADSATVHWQFGSPLHSNAGFPDSNCTEDSRHSNRNTTELALTGFDVVTRVVEDIYNTRTITTVDESYRSLTLTYLKQGTTYVVYVYAIYDEVIRLRSGQTEFETTTDISKQDQGFNAYDFDYPVAEGEKKFTIEEFVLIGVVILVWLSVIGLFLRQWDHIRGMAPRDTSRPRPPTPKAPTNEEYPTITIVQDEKDSLIRTTRF